MKNDYKEFDDYAVIYLITNQGDIYTVFVDLEDLEFIHDNVQSVCLAKRGKNFYAQVRVNDEYVYLHRFLLKPDERKVVDHINFNGLDNRRKNLRVVSQRVNSIHRNPNNLVGAERVRGVHFNKNARKYQAYIKSNGKRTHLGYFTNKDAAAKAANKAREAEWGRF